MEKKKALVATVASRTLHFGWEIGRGEGHSVNGKGREKMREGRDLEGKRGCQRDGSKPGQGKPPGFSWTEG